MKLVHRLILLFVFGAALHAQTFAPSPVLDSPILDTNGNPLAGGKVYTCVSGLTCPGNPQPMYTDSSGATPLNNPITLTSTGYSQCGGPGSSCIAFLDTSLVYRLVIQNSLGVTLYTFDGISASGGGGGGGGTNYWTLSGGSTITNNNGSGAGLVQTGGNFTVGGSATVTGSLGFISPLSGGNKASLSAANSMAANVSWTLPATDSSGVQCLVSNGAGVLAWAACGGGGGGGSPGGIANSVQTNNGGGGFYGDADLLYTVGSPNALSINGVFAANGATGGVDVPTNTANNAIQAPNGGVTGKVLVATDSLFYIEEAAPVVSGAGQARLYADSTSHQLNISKNGAAYVRVATNSGVLTNGDCAQFDASGNVVDAGGACTTGGGGGTVSSANQYDIGYYASTGTTISGSNNFTYNTSTNVVAVAGGFSATGASGAVAVPTSTATNAIQAPNGGSTAKWLTATDSVFWIEEAAPVVSGAGQDKVYGDSTTHTLKVSLNGATYVGIATTAGALTSGHCVSINASGNFIDSGAACGGGGGSTPGGSDTSMQYNKAGTMFGDANIEWLYAGNPELFITTGVNVEGLRVRNGYITADAGFATTSTSTTAIQATSGSIVGKFVSALNAMQIQENTAPPGAAGYGVIYEDSTTHQLNVNKNNGGFLRIATNSGSLTSGDCAQFDASGNVVDSGAACAIPGGAWTTFTPATAGITSPTFFGQAYNQAGKTISIRYDILGTSTGTSVSFTSPFTSFPGVTQVLTCLLNNTSISGAVTPCLAFFSGSNIVTVETQTGGPLISGDVYRIAITGLYQSN